jgi:acetyltransferase-like isoleucine patch superfamily enzyme
LREDHRPYYIKKAYQTFEKRYAGHFLRPQLQHLGKELIVLKPWHIVIFGSPIHIGDFVNIIASPEGKVRLSVWSDQEDAPGIHVGDFCLICPGVQLSATREITIGKNSMLARGVYITDADWHGIYNRTVLGKSAPVVLGDNVWVGDCATVCKGVTIGENSVIGAGSVVVNDIPPHSVAAGNPAKIVKHLDPDEAFITREQWFADPAGIFKQHNQLDRYFLRNNTLFKWLRTLFWPRAAD